MKLTETLCDDVMKRARAIMRTSHAAPDFDWGDWKADEQWFAEAIGLLLKAGHTQRGSFRAALAIYNEARTFDEPLPDNILDLAVVKPLRYPGVPNTLFTDEG